MLNFNISACPVSFTSVIFKSAFLIITGKKLFLPVIYKHLKMIQRIQSVYLSFTILLTLSFFQGTIFSFTDKSVKAIKLVYEGVLVNSSGQDFVQVEKIWLLSVILILIPLVSLLTILIFRNRKIQLFLSLSVIILSAALILTLSWYIFKIVGKYMTDIIPGFRMAVPILILIFSILAYRGIRKDDRLIKSYDRLR